MPVKSDQTLGWTRRSAAVSVLVVLEEHRKELGRRVVRLREGHGWSQEELAHRANVSVKTVSRIENAERETRRYILRRVAEALEVEEAELIGRPPAPLGLGAREDQIDDMAVEFRGYVSKILDLLEEARSERARIEQLLGQQETILERIEAAAKGLPTPSSIGDLREDLNAAAQALTEAGEAVEARHSESESTQAGNRQQGLGAQ